MSQRFSHQFVIAFDVESKLEDASDVTGSMLRLAILKRLSHTPDDELRNEAVEGPNDSTLLELEAALAICPAYEGKQQC